MSESIWPGTSHFEKLTCKVHVCLEHFQRGLLEFNPATGTKIFVRALHHFDRVVETCKHGPKMDVVKHDWMFTEAFARGSTLGVF